MNGMFASLIISQYRCIPKPFLKWEKTQVSSRSLPHSWSEAMGRNSQLTHCIPDPLIIQAWSTLGEMKINVAVFVPNYNR